MIYINLKTLSEMGYEKTQALNIMNQICQKIPSVLKQVYNTTKRHKQDGIRIDNLRSVEIDSVIELCERKIANVNNYANVNFEQWKELLSKLKDMK